ncbi:hypothetical protein Unana1_05105 [Umbelopsis nana]
MSTASKDNPKGHANKDGPSLGRTSPMLSYFCVYNPNLGAKSDENNKEQILFYTAKTVVPLDVKLRQVGLAQALVNFTSAFSLSKSVQTVHTQKARLVFLQVEPNFWLHMSIELGISRYQVRDSNGKLRTVTDYLDAELNDDAVEGILQAGYQMYKLLNGTFSSLLSEDNGKSSVQSIRQLKYSIEEFFSDWIWKWDFDRLESMLFSSVFNGIPMQPILRQSYLKIHKMAENIADDMQLDIKHLLVFNKDNASLIYHNPQLALSSVQLLRKLIIRLLEKWADMRKAEEWRKAANDSSQAKKDPKINSLKALTITFSQKNILGYFGSPSLKPSSAPASAPISPSASPEPNLASALTVPPDLASDSSGTASPAPSLHHGVFLSGLLRSGTHGSGSDPPQPVSIDITKVYLDGDSYEHHDSDGQNASKNLQEYYFVVYKHTSQTLWCFLVPASNEHTESRLYNEYFYDELESLLVKRQIEEISASITKDIEKSKETTLDIAKSYRCLYFDHETLAIKSTLTHPNGQLMDGSNRPKANSQIGGIQISNEMLLLLLDLKKDFDSLPNSREVITRSTANVWVVGQRVPKRDAASNGSISSPNPQDTGAGSGDSDDSFEPLTERAETLALTCTEIYLIAAKKDSTLVDIKDDLEKLADRMTASMYID